MFPPENGSDLLAVLRVALFRRGFALVLLLVLPGAGRALLQHRHEEPSGVLQVRQDPHATVEVEPIVRDGRCSTG